MKNLFSLLVFFLACDISQAQFANDTMTESGGDVDLSAHTSDSGHSWTQRVGDIDVIAASDWADVVGSSGPIYEINATPPSADYKACVNAIWDSTSAHRCTVGIRYNSATGASQSDYAFVMVDSGSWIVVEMVTGTRTVLASGTATAPTADGSTKHEMCISHDGTNLVTTWGPDGQLDTRAESDITATGEAAIGSGLDSNGGNNDVCHYDDLVLTDLSPVSVPVFRHHYKQMESQ